MAITITDPFPIVGRRTWTANEYDRLADLGFFDDEKLELIEGEIIPKMPQNPSHATAVFQAQTALLANFTSGYLVRVQLPLALGDRSRPEPDACVVAGISPDFARTHPSTAVLVLEVSDSTLHQDRETKTALYATHGIPEYWIVNLAEDSVEVFRDPAPQEGALLGHVYRSHQVLNRGDAIVPLAAPEARITVSDLLP